MKTTVLKPNEVGHVRYPVPRGLVHAAGMLKGRLPAALAYQKALRAQWEKRTKRRGR